MPSSYFTGSADSWSIDQLFPVIPLSHHEKKPTHKATIVDITCDSDGCLEKFIDRRDMRNVLDLHSPSAKPYYLGFFLVGAYQESLANEHNLFGAINEAEIIMKEDGKWEITKTTTGDPIEELLTSRNYEMPMLWESYHEQLKIAFSKNLVTEAEAEQIKVRLKQYMESSPYLRENK
ncbi:MAG: hypothetical protein NTX25_18225 [Proteobacteria bacterium]|nr:hypothetical protein [Pseudomonadota bacterium]